jgi:hypothetical protein
MLTRALTNNAYASILNQVHKMSCYSIPNEPWWQVQLNEQKRVADAQRLQLPLFPHVAPVLAKPVASTETELESQEREAA